MNATTLAPKETSAFDPEKRFSLFRLVGEIAMTLPVSQDSPTGNQWADPVAIEKGLYIPQSASDFYTAGQVSRIGSPTEPAVVFPQTEFEIVERHSLELNDG